MRRLLLVLMLAAAAPAWGQVITNPLTRGGIGGIPDCKDSRVFCVGKQAGAEYSTICGVTPGAAGSGASLSSCLNAITAVCQAGSAVVAMAAAGCSLTNPCTLRIGRGSYSECVVIDNITDVNIDCEPGAIIRPSGTNITTVPFSVDGGVLRIGTVTLAAGTTQRVSVRGCTIQNDVWDGHVASAIQIGPKTGPLNFGTGDTTWNDVHVRDNRIISLGDGIHVTGTSVDTEANPPRFTILDNIINASMAGVYLWAQSAGSIARNIIWGKSNHCDSVDAARVGQVTGTVNTTGTALTTTTFRVEVADQIADAGAYYGRKVTFGGGGACPANGHQGWIYCYNAANCVGASTSEYRARFTPAAPGIPDANCTYTIDAVANTVGTGAVINAMSPPCTDIDWSVQTQIAGQSTFTAVPPKGIMLYNLGDTAATDASGLEIADNLIVVEVNDVGIPASTTTTAIYGIGLYEASGYTAYTSVDRLTTRNNAVTIKLNVDLDDSATGIVASGFSLGSDGRIENGWKSFNDTIILENAAELDENVATVTVNSTNDTPGTLAATGLTVDINDPGGYTGTSTHLVQSGVGVLSVGQITSPDVLETSGTIGLMSGSSLCRTFRVSTTSAAADVAGTEYLSAQDGAGLTPNATETNVDDSIVPVAMTYSNLRARVSVAPNNGAGTQSRQIVLRDDAADTAVACTISEASTSCTYTGSPVQVAAGSKMDWKLVTTSTPADDLEMIISVCAGP